MFKNYIDTEGAFTFYEKSKYFKFFKKDKKNSILWVQHKIEFQENSAIEKLRNKFKLKRK